MFTDAQALKIIDDVEAGKCTQAEAAARYGASPMTISNLVNGRTYAHLRGGEAKAKPEVRRRYGRPELPERRRASVAAFWNRVTIAGPNDCWSFHSARPGQYGSVSLALAGTSSAHVVAYVLANGLARRPARGRVIRHLCNNRTCCNPAHLLEGSDAENKADRYRAQRAGQTGPIEVTDPVSPPEQGWIIELGGVAALDRLARVAEFWSQVDRTAGPDSCWPWTGRTTHVFGYGQMRWDGQTTVTAHRIAYLLRHDRHLSELPSDRQVLHRCPGGENPRCCNPRHLDVGDARDNRADAVAYGRVPRGEDHHYGARTTDSAIRALRTDYWRKPVDERPTLTSLAVTHGVSIGTISGWLEGRHRLDAGGPTRPLPTARRRLNADLAREIRHRHHDDNEIVTSLAAAYDVDRETVADVLNGRSFANAGGPRGVVSQTCGMSERTVLDIRISVADGEPVRAVAARLGVSEDAVRQTARGGIHQSVGGPRTRRQLTAADARDIRERHERGESRHGLAKRYGKSKASIDDVLAGRTHATADEPRTA
ncbi:HNH endonuclease [Frankia sp. Ag45/Mut15]|uniref:HNH endonuclease n=1 Tax=Frankia umida TaxID=573489 RepID=A0ABT0JZ14_9ACTN|nr:HNH endonuclease [Frankia umida]MCK9876785.1 HNH endonuclease [Frankia umida]